MRFVILKDKRITDKELKSLTDEFSAFVNQHTGLTPQFFVHEQDYSNVPLETDSDGDKKPSMAFRKQLTDEVYRKYGSWGTDSVVFLVHRKNWVFDGIWGTNWSNVHHTYHVHLCRFDHLNQANSLGTLYHEWMHSLDALIKTHTGFEIDALFEGQKCFADWDTTVVHGNRTISCKETEYAYIKWKDNTQALARLNPWLRQAYQKRKEMYEEPLRKALMQAIAFLRTFIYKKYGVTPYLKKD